MHAHTRTHTGVGIRGFMHLCFCVLFVCILCCFLMYSLVYGRALVISIYVRACACMPCVGSFVGQRSGILCLYLFADHLGMAFFKRSNVFGKIALHKHKLHAHSSVHLVSALWIWLASASLCLLVGPRAASTYQQGSHGVFDCFHTMCSHTLRCNQRISLFETSER